MTEIKDFINVPNDELANGIIVKSTGGLYTVERTGGELYECRAKGAFRKDKLVPLTGDRVKFKAHEDKTGFISEICERKNSLVRPAVANVDLLILVVASSHPEPDLFIIDKLTAIAEFNGIDVLLVVNKCDLKNADELKKIYVNSGIKTVCLSANEPDGFSESLEEIRNCTKGKVSFFSGASGVGKSSLLNVLFPELNLATGEISRKIARGKHTTRVTELFKTGENTYIGDTPGFSMVDVAGFNLLEFDGLLGAFPDIEEYALNCRYTDCTHLCEDGCNVIKAMEQGKVEKTRHDNFVKLYHELKNVNKWK